MSKHVVALDQRNHLIFETQGERVYLRLGLVAASGAITYLTPARAIPVAELERLAAGRDSIQDVGDMRLELDDAITVILHLSGGDRQAFIEAARASLREAYKAQYR